MHWDDFLRKVADNFSLTPAQTEIFLFRFSEAHKADKTTKIYGLAEHELGLEENIWVVMHSNVKIKYAVFQRS